MGRPFANDPDSLPPTYEEAMLAELQQMNSRLTILVSLFTDFMLWQIQPIQDDDPFPTALAQRIEHALEEIKDQDGGDATT